MKDRRIFPRVKTDSEWLFVVQVSRGDSSGVITETKDISCSGLRCKTDEYFEKDSIVELTVLLPLTEKGLIFEKIKCQAKIARCALVINKANSREYFDTAFEFIDFKSKHKEKVSKYVVSHAY